MPKLFAISDLHLSGARPKPMSLFGESWRDHHLRIGQAWRELVGQDDIVLLAGDHSWAMRLPEALVDLQWIADLPGQKVLVKGNHDYWWGGIGKLRAAAPAGLHFVRNDVVRLGGLAVGGARLWDYPECAWPQEYIAWPERPEPKKPSKGPDAEKLRARELLRLELSLSKLPDDAKLRVAMVHFPPLGSDGQPTPITERMSEHRIDLCVYGHMHSLGDQERPGADCVIDGTRYILTSCDWLDFQPLCLGEL